MIHLNHTVLNVLNTNYMYYLSTNCMYYLSVMLLPIKATFSSEFDTSITKEYQLYPKNGLYLNGFYILAKAID